MLVCFGIKKFCSENTGSAVLPLLKKRGEPPLSDDHRVQETEVLDSPHTVLEIKKRYQNGGSSSAFVSPRTTEEYY